MISDRLKKVIFSFFNLDELPPEAENLVVKERKYEVKTHAVIEDLGIDNTEPVSGFKKRRARNIRKKNTND